MTDKDRGSTQLAMTWQEVQRGMGLHGLFCAAKHFQYRSQWPRDLNRRSAAARLMKSWVGMHRWHGLLSVVVVMYRQVEVSGTS
jgi:hypothetical protein